MRKQAAITLRCMQALVRVQARVRARRVRIALESQTEQHKIQQQLVNEAHVREIEVSQLLLIFDWKGNKKNHAIVAYLEKKIAW